MPILFWFWFGLVSPLSQPAWADLTPEQSACFLRLEENDALFKTFDTNTLYKSCCQNCADLNVTYLQAANRSTVLKWVLGCAFQAPFEKVKTVDHWYFWTCKKRRFWMNEFLHQRAHYRMWRGADGVHVNLRTRFRIEPRAATDERARFMLQKTRECLPDIQKLWARYGVRMEMEFDSDREPTFSERPDYSVGLSDEIEGNRRSLADYIYFLNGAFRNSGKCLSNCMETKPVDTCKQECESDRQGDYCYLLAHESGHWLGLSDEYVDTDRCPDRDTLAQESFPYSPMQDFSYDWDALELYPRHLKTVVGPLCNK